MPRIARVLLQNRRHRLLKAALVALTAVMLLDGAVARAMVPPYSVEELTSLSTDIVIGRVVDATSEWQEWPYGGRVIMTTYTVEVGDQLKGRAPRRLAVVLPGGRVGDVTIHASCTPAFAAGQELALFLKKDLKGLPRWWVFGLERGAFEIVGDEARSMAEHADPLPLQTLRTRVARAVEAENDLH